jgi:septum formation inhibitor MinC
VSLRTPTGTSSKIFSSLASSDAASAPSNLNGLSTPTGEVVKYPDAPLGSLPPLDFIPVQSPNSPSASFATSEANHDSFSAEVGQSLSSGQRTLHKVMRTCRAGTALQFEGDVIVFGDLNAGAEIKATGDIIVLGSLRGLAHAGHLGETQAKIYATDLSPTQLRLADQIAIPPAGDNARPRTKMSFEIAFLNEDKKIEVKSFTIGRPTK